MHGKVGCAAWATRCVVKARGKPQGEVDFEKYTDGSRRYSHQPQWLTSHVNESRRNAGNESETQSREKICVFVIGLHCNVSRLRINCDCASSSMTSGSTLYQAE